MHLLRGEAALLLRQLLVVVLLLEELVGGGEEGPLYAAPFFQAQHRSPTSMEQAAARAAVQEEHLPGAGARGVEDEPAGLHGSKTQARRLLFTS
jgi:predicted small lipoprotein YifL